MTDFKKLLLAGTAIVAIGGVAVTATATPAYAIEIDNDQGDAGGDTATVGTTAIGAITGDANNTDTLNIDLNGTDTTAGTDATTQGINVSDTNDVESLGIVNSSTTAATLTLEQNAGGAAIVADASTDLDLFVGAEYDGSTASDTAVTLVVGGDITHGGTAGDISIQLGAGGTNANVLVLQGDVDLEATGDVDMQGDNNVLRFAGSSAQTWTAGLIEGGNVDINQSVDFAATTAMGGNTDIETVTVAAGMVAEVNGDWTTDEDGTDFLLEGAAAEINVASTATLTGSITASTANTGILDVDADTDVVGSIGTATTAIGTVETAQDTTLTVDATTADVVYNAASTEITDDNVSDGIVFDTSASDNAITVYSAITTATADTGLVGTANEGTVTFEADLGEEDTEIGLFMVGDATNDSTVVTKGNIYATDTEINDESTLTITGTNITVSGTIGGANDGEGNLVVGDGDAAASVTFESEIGGTDLDALTISANATANVSNDVSVTAADGVDGLSIDGTLVVDSTGAAITVDSVDGNTVLDGTLTVTGDNGLTLGGADAITVAGDGAATINAGDEITLDDDLTIGDSTGTDVFTIYAAGRDGNGGSDDGFDPAGTGVVVLDAASNNVAIGTGATLRVGLSGGEYDSGDTITFLDNVGTLDVAGAVDDGDIVFLNNGLVRLTEDASTDTNTLVGAVSFRSASNVFSKATYAGAADSLLALSAASTTGSLATIRSNLTTSSTSSSDLEDIAESISPTVDGGATNTALTNVSNSSMGLTGTRLAALRDSDGAMTGMSAGNLTHGLKMWAQAFGTTGEQDERDGIAGYDVDTYGVTVGIDTQTLAEDWVWGLAFTYADTEVDSANVNNTQTDIDTYQISVYADYMWDAQTYINGIVGYGFNDADQTRSNVGTLNNLTASSDYDTDQFFAKIESGRDYELKNGTTLTPFALANFTYLDTEGYTETGAGTANLEVDTDDQYVFELGLGLEASWLHELEDGSYLKPKLAAGYRYDLADDEVETTATFTGGGAAFTTEGFDNQNHTFNVGAGLTFYTTANWELSANYDYELKEDYDAHNGYVRAAYRF